MHVTTLAIFYWVEGMVIDLVLFLVLLYRHRWRQFPLLASWLLYMVVRTIILMILYARDLGHLYRVVYLTGLFFEFGLQLAVVAEVARIVMRPTGTWIRDAWQRFAIGGLGGIVVAALLAWWITPPAPYAWKMWQVRGNLFTSMVICELFVVMTLTANRLGLGWRNHVMAIAQGLTAWSGIVLVKTAVESYLGTQRHYLQLEQVRYLTYTAAICWIAVQLWRNEPERRPISPDLREYILALHRRVEYDLRRLDAGH